VDGHLLLRLTDNQLKKDLGMLPLGHRTVLLEAIAKLKDEAPSIEGGQVAATGTVFRGRLTMCQPWWNPFNWKMT